MPRTTCIACGARQERLRGDGRRYCDPCYARTGTPCHGCGEPVRAKTRVRVGDGLEGYFCPTCAPGAREAARRRFQRNARRWGLWQLLSTKEAA